MESRHANYKANSSNKEQQKPSEPKCYSLPTLQKENAKLKYDLKVLQAAYNEKEILLNETSRKVELLDEQNNELKCLLIAPTSANEETVELKDASTWVRIKIKNVSTSTSIVNIASEIQGEDEVGCKTKNVSNVANEIQDEDEVECNAKNVSTSRSVVNIANEIQGEDVVGRKTVLFDETVQELPYDEETEITALNKNSEDPTFYSNMQKHFEKIGGANISKVVNNILNAIATKKLQKKFVWEATAPNSFQNLNKILSCIHSAVCSKENTQQNVNNIIKNALKNARNKL